MSKYTCEYQDDKLTCDQPAVARYARQETDPADGPSTYETYRCANHAESNYQGSANIFDEIMYRFAPTLFEEILPPAPQPTPKRPVQFFESLAAVRAAERRVAESADYMDLDDIGYLTAFTCPAGDGYINDARHAFIGLDGRMYHSRDCADLNDMEG